MIDPAGFKDRPKEPLGVAVFALALPSPAFLASRLEATRPLLRVGATRVQAVIPGTTLPGHQRSSAARAAADAAGRGHESRVGCAAGGCAGTAAGSGSARSADAGDLPGPGVHRHRGVEPAGASRLFAAQSQLAEWKGTPPTHDRTHCARAPAHAHAHGRLDAACVQTDAAASSRTARTARHSVEARADTRRLRRRRRRRRTVSPACATARDPAGAAPGDPSVERPSPVPTPIGRELPRVSKPESKPESKPAPKPESKSWKPRRTPSRIPRRSRSSRHGQIRTSQEALQSVARCHPENSSIRAPAYFLISASAARTSSLCLAGLTPVQTLATLPAGSIRKVLRDATPRGLQRPVLVHHLLVRVGEQLEREALFGAELFVAIGGIHADADDDGVLLLVLRQVLLEVVGFDGAALRHVLRVEVQHHPLSLIVLQADVAALLGRQRELRRRLSNLRHFRRARGGKW